MDTSQEVSPAGSRASFVRCAATVKWENGQESAGDAVQGSSRPDEKFQNAQGGGGERQDGAIGRK